LHLLSMCLAKDLRILLEGDRSRNRANAGADAATPAFFADIHLSLLHLDYIVEAGTQTALAIRAEFLIDDGPFFGRIPFRRRSSPPGGDADDFSGRFISFPVEEIIQTFNDFFR